MPLQDLPRPSETVPVMPVRAPTPLFFPPQALTEAVVAWASSPGTWRFAPTGRISHGF